MFLHYFPKTPDSLGKCFQDTFKINKLLYSNRHFLEELKPFLFSRTSPAEPARRVCRAAVNVSHARGPRGLRAACHWGQPLREVGWRVLKKLTAEPSHDSAVPPLGVYPKKPAANSKDVCAVLASPRQATRGSQSTRGGRRGSCGGMCLSCTRMTPTVTVRGNLESITLSGVTSQEFTDVWSPKHATHGAGSSRRTGWRRPQRVGGRVRTCSEGVSRAWVWPGTSVSPIGLESC